MAWLDSLKTYFGSVLDALALIATIVVAIVGSAGAALIGVNGVTSGHVADVAPQLGNLTAFVPTNSGNVVGAALDFAFVAFGIIVFIAGIWVVRGIVKDVFA